MPYSLIFSFSLISALFFSHITLGQVHFQSPQQTVNVIELYTSEGCSSCPPADRWLSDLKSNADLFNKFIPLAFHVDYWNYLGWRDKYSRAEFSQRQRHYHRLGQVSGVYTPGMFLNGYEYRGWRSLKSERVSQLPVKRHGDTGILNINYENGKTQLSFSTSDKDTLPGKAYVALLGTNIDAPIQAGENKGRTLRHDFVVLDLQQAPLKKNAGGDFVATLPKLVAQEEAPRYALAAWITNEKDSKPLQATGGWLP